MVWPASARSGPFNAILRYNQEPTRPLGGLESSYWGQMGVLWEWLTQGWVQLPQAGSFWCQGRAGFSFLHALPQNAHPIVSLSPHPQGRLDGSPLICPADPLMALPKPSPHSKAAPLPSWPR